MEEAYVSGDTPDWSTDDVELDCPRCGYNLRMLTVARCPECGLQFRWDELIKAKEEFHTRPPIFEYHWRDHPIRSLAFTVSMCLQPWRLWRWLPLTAVPSVRVMPLQLLSVILLLSVISASGEFISHVCNHIQYWGRCFPRDFPWQWWLYRFKQEIVTPSFLALAIWFSIQIFRQTLARYQIQQRHILRLVAFCWIGMVSSRIICDFVVTVMTWAYYWSFNRWFPFYYPIEWFLDVVPLIILLLSLGFGFHSYLRVRGGWLWAILLLAFTSAMIVMVGLVVSVVILDSFDNAYWKTLADWSAPFSLLRDLASWAFLARHGY
jgi:hypothetical protein